VESRPRRGACAGITRGTSYRLVGFVLDVGANIGVHALTAAKRLEDLGGGRVIAVEPAADCVAKLGTAAARNGLPLEVVPAALGEWRQHASLRADSRYDAADAGVRSPSTATERSSRRCP
jgi:FkbM family methyltransferase